MIGIDQLRILRVFQIFSRVFPCMSQAILESSFGRIEKHRRVAAGHSAALKLKRIAGRLRSSGFTRPTETSMWSVSLEGELCWRCVLGNRLGWRCHDPQTILSWMFKLAWRATYSLKNTPGFRISGHLPTCKRMYKSDIEMKAEAKSSYRTSHN